MNYLAHFHLNYGNDQWLLGALLGDHVKGPLKGVYDKALEQGIWLHRKIDAFTDQHADIRRLQRQFQPEFRRYSGIMLDVAFDYFLSQHWHQFHHQSLVDFNGEIYQLLARHHFPVESAQRQAERLCRYDVLGSFEHWSTVEIALLRISERLRRDNPLGRASAELDRHYPDIESAFLSFYPELVSHCEQLRQSLD